MTAGNLSGRRVLILGADTRLGRALASALSEVGAQLALVAASTNADASFAVQRLSRRLPARPGVGPSGRSSAQAIDATNEMAVRVMIRRVGKELGGLDALLFCADLGAQTASAFGLACRFGGREVARGGGGAIVGLGADLVPQTPAAQQHAPGVRISVVGLSPREEPTPQAIEEVLALAAPSEEGA